MFLYAPPQTIRGSKLYVPLEIRAALGWHDGLTLFIAQCANSGACASQLLVSSVAPVTRSDLWHLAMRFRDRPGLVADLSNLLRSRDIDIVACKVNTRNHISAIVVEADIDARLYASKYDSDSPTRQQRPAEGLRELHAFLLARFLDDAYFAVDGTPYITLTRHHQLRRSVNETDEKQQATLDKGTLSLTRGVLDKIRDDSAIHWPHLRTSARLPAAMLVASPLVFSLTITIFYPTTGHIHVRVAASNRKGLLAALTSQIHERGMNIVHMYARNAKGETSILDFFLHFSSDTEHDDQKLRTFVKGTLHNKVLKEWKSTVSFPKPQAKPPQRKYERTTT